MELSELIEKLNNDRDEIKTAFNRSLKMLRQDFNYSLLDLEEKTNIKNPSLSRYENNKVEPSVSQALIIANAFSMDIEDFISCSVDENAEQRLIEGKKDFYCFSAYDSISIDEKGNPIFYLQPQHKKHYFSYNELYMEIKNIDWRKLRESVFLYQIPDNSMSPIYNKNDLILFAKENYPFKENYDGLIAGKDKIVKLRHIRFTGEPSITLTHYEKIAGDNSGNVISYKKIQEEVNYNDCTFIGRVLMTIRKN